MKDSQYIIINNRRIAADTFELLLAGDTSQIERPGQFVDLKIEGFYLRRPISICRWDREGLTLIYRIAGKGTEKLSRLQPDEVIDMLCPLGNGYDLEKIPAGAVLAGGGAGVPPMYGLAEKLATAGKKPRAVLGWKSEEEAFYVDEFKELGIETDVKIGGYITDLIEPGQYVCGCGPEMMLKALCEAAADGQFSFEARMGCGFGACMGCTCRTKYGPKRICKDGPVLTREEIVW